MDGRIFHIQAKLRSNLNKFWSLEKMADEVGLSTPHFHKIFKENLGLSPMTFLQNLRLEKARELLENTFLQIQEIRCEVGMSGNTHFTHDFKAKYGLTPTEYRKDHWSKVQIAFASATNNRI